MSEIDPLIRREIQWMALGVLENRDIAPLVIARVRRRRIMRAIIGAGATLSIVLVTILGVSVFTNNSSKTSPTSGTIASSSNPETILNGLTSRYDIGWDASVGVASGAISKAGGLGDTLGGLTATGIKVEWGTCGGRPCPVTLTLGVENRTTDIVSQTLAVGLFIDHAPIFSTSRPVTITSGEATVITFTFDPVEYKANDILILPRSTWQWNWYLSTTN